MAPHDYADDTETRPHPEDAIAILQADHHRVRDLVQQYVATNAHDLKRHIAAHVFTILEHHAQLEETIFYPAFAAQADEEGDRLVDGARQEHQLIRDLSAELRDIDDVDVFEARFHELMDHVAHHIDEEEAEIFPQAQAQLADQMEEITAKIQALRKQLRAS